MTVTALHGIERFWTRCNLLTHSTRTNNSTLNAHEPSPGKIFIQLLPREVFDHLHQRLCFPFHRHVIVLHSLRDLRDLCWQDNEQVLADAGVQLTDGAQASRANE